MFRTVRVVILILAFCMLLNPMADSADAQSAPEPQPRLSPERPFAPTTGGFTPPTMDLSHLRLRAHDPAKDDPLPARYDARDLDIVSPIKDQGACGACYSFAMAGDLEATILQDFATLVDISENHLKECHFEERSCEGGNASMVVNLASSDGSRSEACDPYVAADVECNTTCDPTFAVLNWRMLTGASGFTTDALKQAIVDHGPISTSVYAGDESNTSWWNEFGTWSGGNGLYHSGAETNNHAVMLVGWDDDHPHDGGGTGCWIMRNSWGASWGDACGGDGEAGYCYIAYGAAGIGQYSSVVTEVMPSYPELNVVGLDEAGWQQSFGYDNTVGWGLVRLDVDEITNLHCVEFWTTDAGSNVQVQVYDTKSGNTLSGLLDSVVGLNFDSAGYQSVPLSEPLPLVPGDYYVAVRFSNTSGLHPIPVDTAGPTAAGQSWVSSTGSTWLDVGSGYSCDVGIRIRTSPHEVLPTEDDGDTPPVALDTAIFELHAPWPNPFNPATTISFSLGEATDLTLRVYDLQGRLVRVLEQGHLSAGVHHVRWNGRDRGERAVAAGVYLCRLDDGWRQRTRRLVLVR